MAPLTGRTRTILAMLVLPLAVVGVYARTLAVRLPVAQSDEAVEAPADWVAFGAKVTITHPKNPTVYGRYWRASNGSERLDTGPAPADMKVITIRSVPELTLYLFGPRGWTREPMELLNSGRPLPWKKGLPNWQLHPYRLALAKGESGSLTASTGFSAYRVTTGQGIVTFKVAELNLFDVVRQRPDGRHEVYSEIELGEPAPALFIPPAGAVVIDRAPTPPPELGRPAAN
jgi:hypothetical protein